MAFAPLLRCWQLTFRKGIAIAFLAFGVVGVSPATAENAVCLDVPFQGFYLHNLTINGLNGGRYFYAIPPSQSEVNWSFPSKHEGGRQKSRWLIFSDFFGYRKYRLAKRKSTEDDQKWEKKRKLTGWKYLRSVGIKNKKFCSSYYSKGNSKNFHGARNIAYTKG